MPRVNDKQSQKSNDSVVLRRIASDLRQLETEDLLGISALPIDGNMFEWHLNVYSKTGKMAGAYIHCIMTFTTAYPSRPPQIRCCTPYGHANVFGSIFGQEGFICLSMLDDKYHSWQPFEGWSSAYSLPSILMQLQSFLLDDRLIRSPNTSNCTQFKCTKCGHSHEQPFPAVRVEHETVPRDIACDNRFSAPWIDLPQDVAGLLFEFLDSVSMYRASWTCHEWFSVCDSYNLLIRNEMICYHSKLTYQECVLGFGMELTNNRNKTSRKQFKIHMDYVSNIAWDTGIRSSVWGQPLTHWIPIVINSSHGSRAGSLLTQALEMIEEKDPLTAIARLMNGIVVSLAQNVTGVGPSSRSSRFDRYGRSSGEDQAGLIMSEKALVGYFALHQTLLWLVCHNEELYGVAETRANRLRQGVEKMTKSRVPDLGEYLVYMSCVNGIEWGDISGDFMFEAWTRGVLWYTRDDSSLNYPCDVNYEKIFHARRVGRTLVSFQIYFITEVCGRHTNIGDMLSNYNRKLGRPSRQSVLKLHTFCKNMKRQQELPFAKQLSSYWRCLHVRPMSRQKFGGFLGDTVQASVARGYHSRRLVSDREAFGAAHGGNCVMMNQYIDGLRMASKMSHLDITDSNGRTLLHFAARSEAVAVVGALVDAGVNVDAVDRWGKTALDAVKESMTVNPKKCKQVIAILQKASTKRKSGQNNVEEGSGSGDGKITQSKNAGKKFDCELSIRNLPGDCTVVDLESVLRRCGFEMAGPEMQIQATRFGKAFAFVNVTNVTESLIQSANRYMFRGGPIFVEKARRRQNGLDTKPNEALFVTRLDARSELEALKIIEEKFVRFGNLRRRPYISLDRNEKYFAFVTFESVDAAKNARATLDGRKVGNQRLVVQFKREQVARAGRDGRPGARRGGFGGRGRGRMRERGRDFGNLKQRRS